MDNTKNFILPLLPHWCITDLKPSFYDTESTSAIGQTAKLYAKMKELVESYNKWVDEINSKINQYDEETNADLNQFKNDINKICHDYIVAMDMKIECQDREIEESIAFIKDNIGEAVREIVDEMGANGELSEAIMNSFNSLELRVTRLETERQLGHVYDDLNESLILTTSTNAANTLYVNNVSDYSIDKENEQVNIEEEE